MEENINIQNGENPKNTEQAKQTVELTKRLII